MLYKTIGCLFIIGLSWCAGVDARFEPTLVAVAEQETVDTNGQAGESLAAAASRIQQKIGGEVLSADEVVIDNRTVYRIKLLLPQGRVRVVNVYPNRS